MDHTEGFPDAPYAHEQGDGNDTPAIGPRGMSAEAAALIAAARRGESHSQILPVGFRATPDDGTEKRADADACGFGVDPLPGGKA